MLAFGKALYKGSSGPKTATKSDRKCTKAVPVFGEELCEVTEVCPLIRNG